MAQSSTKKRKPNPFEDHSPPAKKQCGSPLEGKEASSYSDSSTLIPDDIPFKLECPVRKPTKNKKQRGKDDAYGPQEEDGGYTNLKISYTIRPGKTWTDLKTYKNFSSKSCQ
jgi:hypothetical protein